MPEQVSPATVQAVREGSGTVARLRFSAVKLQPSQEAPEGQASCGSDSTSDTSRPGVAAALRAIQLDEESRRCLHVEHCAGETGPPELAVAAARKELLLAGNPLAATSIPTAPAPRRDAGLSSAPCLARASFPSSPCRLPGPRRFISLRFEGGEGGSVAVPLGVQEPLACAVRKYLQAVYRHQPDLQSAAQAILEGGHILVPLLGRSEDSLAIHGPMHIAFPSAAKALQQGQAVHAAMRMVSLQQVSMLPALGQWEAWLRDLLPAADSPESNVPDK